MLKPKITREYLQAQVGEHNIYEFYFGEFEVGKSYFSVFRDEQRPSTGFFINAKGHIVYNDYSANEKYDFVHFVMKLYGLTYYKAIERIAIDFGLIPGERSKEAPAVIKPIEAVKVKKKKNYTIGVIPFKKEHLEFWAKYGITKQDLIKNGIKAVGKLQVDDYALPYALRFLYTFAAEGERYFKIYTPHSAEHKWAGNVPQSIPFGLTDLTCTHSTLIITKSVKDCLVLRKLFPEVIGLQNEGSGSLTKATLNALKKCYKSIYYFGDNDAAGLKFGKWMLARGVTPLTFPEQFLTKYQVKDASDFVYLWGVDNLKIWFSKNTKLIEL